MGRDGRLGGDTSHSQQLESYYYKIPYELRVAIAQSATEVVLELTRQEKTYQVPI